MSKTVTLCIKSHVSLETKSSTLEKMLVIPFKEGIMAERHMILIGGFL